jgi:D-sedoheptulose 7-phosphate isomerase
MANEQAFATVFARQVRALGSSGDVLLALSVDGNCANLQQAIHAAHEREMVVIGLSGHGGGAMAQLMRDTDNHVDVPHERSARILEILMLVLHCMCDAVDAQLLGEQEETN